MTYFEEIGGELALSALIDEFVERVCSDTMIGFLFGRVNRERLKRMEYEHAAQFLGAPVAYWGAICARPTSGTQSWAGISDAGARS